MKDLDALTVEEMERTNKYVLQSKGGVDMLKTTPRSARPIVESESKRQPQSNRHQVKVPRLPLTGVKITPPMKQQ